MTGHLHSLLTRHTTGRWVSSFNVEVNSSTNVFRWLGQDRSLTCPRDSYRPQRSVKPFVCNAISVSRTIGILDVALAPGTFCRYCLHSVLNLSGHDL